MPPYRTVSSDNRARRVTSLVNRLSVTHRSRERLNDLERLSELGDPAALQNTGPHDAGQGA